jgi:hypothetical protein
MDGLVLEEFANSLAYRRVRGDAMTLEQLFLNAENRLYNLGWCPWTNDASTQVREQTDALCEDLCERHDALPRLRATLDDARQRWDELVVQSTMLASRIEASVFNRDSDSAWRLALELDQTRRAAEEECERVGRLEQKAREAEAMIQRLEGRLARLQEKLYS